ncbi:putative adhesin [Lentzea sp. NPDC058436]|uniref:putative adhesin n=1 Tax=Lentzea sp. NPDC058436 TaxID=3346499 RepID=UPI00365024ED
MVGVVIGHGSFDGTETVVVPAGLTLHFFTEEGTGLAIVNLLELLRAGNPRIPMGFAKPGTVVPNYRYDPFAPHERRAITALNENPAPTIVVGSPETPNTLRLCADVRSCPKDGPHTCDGVFGRAARAKWNYLMIFSCRIDTRQNLAPTLDLMAPQGRRDRSAHQALVDWVQTFVGLDAARQDALWAGLSPNERLRLVASDEEVREWDDCRAVRETITASPDPAKVAAAASVAVRTRLIRDHPEHRAAVRAGLRSDPADARAVKAFLPLSFDDRVDVWEALSEEARLRWMADQEVTHWAAGFNACFLFRYGLRGDHLLGLLRKLEPGSLAVVMTEVLVTDHLTENGLHV